MANCNRHNRHGDFACPECTDEVEAYFSKPAEPQIRPVKMPERVAYDFRDAEPQAPDTYEAERDRAAEAFALQSGYRATYDRSRLAEGFEAGADWAKEREGTSGETYRQGVELLDKALALTKERDQWRAKCEELEDELARLTSTVTVRGEQRELQEFAERKGAGYGVRDRFEHEDDVDVAVGPA